MRQDHLSRSAGLGLYFFAILDDAQWMLSISRLQTDKL
jgi:hypothetical protein